MSLTCPKRTKNPIRLHPLTPALIPHGGTVETFLNGVILQQPAFAIFHMRCTSRPTPSLLIVIVDLYVVANVFCKVQLESLKKFDADTEFLSSFDFDISCPGSLLILIGMAIVVLCKWLTINYDAHVNRV